MPLYSNNIIGSGLAFASGEVVGRPDIFNKDLTISGKEEFTHQETLEILQGEDWTEPIPQLQCNNLSKMAKDVKITPAAGKVEFQDSSTNYAYISGDPTAGAGKIFIGTEETGIQILDTQVDDSVFSVYGSEGTLFNVSDDLSDSLMSVNDAAGLPVFEAFADDRIIAGEYNQNDLVVSGNNVGIGLSLIHI